MKINNIYLTLLAAVSTAAVSCSDYNDQFDGYEDMAKPTDIRTIAYTMTDDDYKSIDALSKKTYFSAENPATELVPGFLDAAYPTVDNGSAVKVTYNFEELLPAYLLDLNNSNSYTLTAEDYQTAIDAEAKFFSSKITFESKASTILSGVFAEAASGDIVVAEYKYSEDNGETIDTKWATYKLDNTTWKAYEKVLMPSKSEFSAMGLSYPNFSSSAKPENYLPQWLRMQLPYAANDDIVTVVYNFYNGSKTVREAAEYILVDGAWCEQSYIITQTDQFVKNNEVWMYNPSVIINLEYVRNEPTVMAYYQAVVDWVWENIDKGVLGLTDADKGKGYVSSYGNNDYYTGCSAYYNNVDMRTAKASEQYPEGYAGLSDDQIKALMIEHLIEAWAGALSNLYPEATLIDGIDILYTINLPIYDGNAISDMTHTMSFKVVGNGEFEYVKDSFKEIAK